MSATKQLTQLFDSERTVITLRLERCKLQQKRIALWVQKARRLGENEIAEAIETGCAVFFEEQEKLLQEQIRQTDQAQQFFAKVCSMWKGAPDDQ